MARRAYTNGATVGRTIRDNRAQKFESRNTNTVTIGSNIPRSSDGKAGDIAIRKLPEGTYRAFVKIGAGWYDINAMVPSNRVKWTDMNLKNSWSAYSTAVEVPGFFKDDLGIVHLRGCIKAPKVTGTTYAAVDSNPDTITDSGDGFVTAGFAVGTTILVAGSSAGGNNTTHVLDGVATGTLTLSGDSTLTVDGAGDTWTIQSNPSTAFVTLPAGLRPKLNQYRLILDDDPTSPTTSNLAVLKIATDGNLSLLESGNTSGATLDGVTYFVPQKTSSLSSGHHNEDIAPQGPGPPL